MTNIRYAQDCSQYNSIQRELWRFSFATFFDRAQPFTKSGMALKNCHFDRLFNKNCRISIVTDCCLGFSEILSHLEMPCVLNSCIYIISSYMCKWLVVCKIKDTVFNKAFTLSKIPLHYGSGCGNRNRKNLKK